MSSSPLNETALRALKRHEIQHLAKREGIRANGKTEDMIQALMAKHSDGVQLPEKAPGPVRRSTRLNATKPKEEEKAGEVEVEPPVYGDSAPQYVPPKLKRKVKATTENTADEEEVAPRRRRTATPPPPPPRQREQDIPALRPTIPIPVPKAGRRVMGAEHNPATARPMPEFVHGSSTLVNNQGPAQRGEREHLTTGVPTRTAAQDDNHSRLPDGVLYRTQESSIARAGSQAGTEQSVPRISTPRPQQMAISPAYVFRHSSAVGLRPQQPLPRHPQLPPSFTRLPPPPVQPEAGPSRLPNQAGPSRLAPWSLYQPEAGPSSLAFPRPSPPQRPRAPSRLQPQAAPYQMGAPPVLGWPPAPQTLAPPPQPEAGPSRHQIDPRDTRFKLPATPDHVHRGRHQPVVPLRREETVARQPRPSTSQPRHVPTPAKIPSSADADQENAEAHNGATSAPAPAPLPQAGPSGQPNDASLNADEPMSPLDPIYSRFMASTAQDAYPEPVESMEIKMRAYSALHQQFVEDIADINSEEEAAEDEEDTRLAEMQQQSKAAHAARPEPTSGVSVVIAQDMIQSGRLACEKSRGIKQKREKLARILEYMQAQADMVEEWTTEMRAKRLVLEHMLMMQLKDWESGWMEGKWKPSLAEMIQIAGELQQDDDDDAAASTLERGEENPFAGPRMHEGDNGFLRSDDSELGPPNRLQPAFEYRPRSARPSFSSSPLPPPPPPWSESFPVRMRGQPDPVTYSRRTPGAPSSRRQAEPDILDGDSPESPDSGRRPKTLHPSRMVDEAERGPRAQPQAGPSQQAATRQIGPTGAFALQPALFPYPGQLWGPSVSTEYGSSVSQSRKRRRNEDDDEADSKWESSNERHSVSQPIAGPSQQRGYVHRPVPGSNGFEGSVPEPDYPWAGRYTQQGGWRDLHGTHISPLPSPKRARRE